MAGAIATEVTDEFIRTAFERCPSGLIVVDRAGIITVVNQEVERLLGYCIGETMSLDELRTHGVTQLLPKPYRADDLKAMARTLLDQH